MITEALQKIGPCLSTELAEYLIKTHGLSPVSARQRISRSEPGVKKLGHLPFPKKSRFVYLESQYASYIFWRNLYKAIDDLNGPYSRALKAVRARTLIPIEHFKAVCGAPKLQKKQVNADMVLERLVNAGILVKADVTALGWCILTKKTYDDYSGDFNELGKDIASRLIVENILLQAVSDWLKRLGMVSYESVQLRPQNDSALPTVGTFAWDLTAPTYIPGLTTTREGKRLPGFVACDVLLNKQVKMDDIDPFLNKVNTIQILKSIGRTMYIFVADSYSKEAFNALKQLGIVPATTENLFGSEIAKALKSLIGALEKAAKGVVDSDAFLHLFSSLGPLEGAVGNLRGHLFEFVVAEILRCTVPANTSIEIGRKIKTSKNEAAEIDIWAEQREKSLRCIECKGMSSSSYVDDAEIERWLYKRIPTIQSYLKEKGELASGLKPVYELWTCGEISEQSLNTIAKIKETVHKYEILVFNAQAILDEAKNSVNKSVIDLLHRVYIQPLALLKAKKAASVNQNTFSATLDNMS